MVRVVAAKSRIKAEYTIETRQSRNDRPSRISLGANDSARISLHCLASGARGLEKGLILQTRYTRENHMENKFDYWVRNDAGKFLRLYWIQYCLFYVLGAWLALNTRTLSAFFIIGFLPYLVIHIYRRSHNPFNDIENGIKKYNLPLHERLSKLISEKRSKQRAASIYTQFMREPDAKLDSDLLAFKKNYNRINTHAMMSLSLWFFSSAALTIYMFVTRR
ncbi:MAG: hypothetical protein HGB35_07510 [Geobacteraceae bacterium]|nr:hypothetical protein [Geobacteraceae bacterium]